MGELLTTRGSVIETPNKSENNELARLYKKLVEYGYAELLRGRGYIAKANLRGGTNENPPPHTNDNSTLCPPRTNHHGKGEAVCDEANSIQKTKHNI